MVPALTTASVTVPNAGYSPCVTQVAAPRLLSNLLGLAFGGFGMSVKDTATGSANEGLEAEPFSRDHRRFTRGAPMTKPISILALLALGISTTDASAEGPATFDWTITLEVPEQGLKGSVPVDRKGGALKLALSEWQCQYGVIPGKGIEALIVQCNVAGKDIGGNRMPHASTDVRCSTVQSEATGKLSVGSSGMGADKSFTTEIISIACKKH